MSAASWVRAGPSSQRKPCAYITKHSGPIPGPRPGRCSPICGRRRPSMPQRTHEHRAAGGPRRPAHRCAAHRGQRRDGQDLDPVGDLPAPRRGDGHTARRGSSPSPSRAPRPPSCASASGAGSARCSTSWRAAGPTMGCAPFSPRGSPTPDARDSSCARPCTASTMPPSTDPRLLPAGAVRPGVRERHALRDRGPGRCQRVARRGGCGLLAPTDCLAAHRTGRRPGSPPP